MKREVIPHTREKEPMFQNRFKGAGERDSESEREGGREGRERERDGKSEEGSLEVTFRRGELCASRQSTRSLSGDTEKSWFAAYLYTYTRTTTCGVSTYPQSDGIMLEKPFNSVKADVAR